jgi:cysteine desulfurase / selenocysteine lyase
MLDILEIRRQTPYIDNHLFFNSAGSSIPTQASLDTYLDYLDLEARHGGYEIMIADPRINETYHQLASLLHCQAHNLALAESATLALNNALSSIDFKEGDCIVTSPTDYGSNFMFYEYVKQRLGVKIAICKVDKDRQVDVGHVEDLIKNNKTKLVSISHIPTNTGIIHDVKAIGNVCTANDVIYAIDACQSAGQLALNVDELKCDILTFTGRKFMRGPRGIGVTYLSDKFLARNYQPIMMDGNGAQWIGDGIYQRSANAKRYEPFERSYAGIAALGTAVQYINDLGMKNIENQCRDISQYARDRWQNIDRINLMDRGLEKSNIITLHSEYFEIDTLKQYLTSHKVKYTIATKMAAYYDMTEKQIEWALRLSPHYFNTKVEVDNIADILASFIYKK